MKEIIGAPQGRLSYGALKGALIIPNMVIGTAERFCTAKIAEKRVFLRKNRDFSRKNAIFSRKLVPNHFPDAKTRFEAFRDRENMR